MLRRLVQMALDIAETFVIQFGRKRGRALQVTGASCVGSA